MASPRSEPWLKSSVLPLGGSLWTGNEHSHPAFDVLGSQRWERSDPALKGLTV